MEPVHIPTPDELRWGMILLVAQGTFLGVLAAAVVHGVVKWLAEKLAALID